MSTDYITLEELKGSLEVSGLNYMDPDLQRAITAASQGVEEYCSRIFATGSTAEVRYFMVEDPQTITIDDLVSVQSVKADFNADQIFEATWSQGTDFLLTPRNSLAFGRPFTEITTLPTAYYQARYSLYRIQLQVTGQFGWPDVPAGVKQAVGILATRFVRRNRDAPFGVAGVGFDNVAFRIPVVDPDVRFLLDPYSNGATEVMAW